MAEGKNPIERVARFIVMLAPRERRFFRRDAVTSSIASTRGYMVPSRPASKKARQLSTKDIHSIGNKYL